MPKLLPVKDPADSVLIRFDFSRTTASVVSATASAAVLDGVDATPGDLITGSPIINGPFVDQRVSGGIDGVNYGLSVTASTVDGDTLVLAAMLPVRSKLTETC